MNKSRKVGPLRVRPHIRDGVPTGKWFLDIPASVTGTGNRKRKLFDNQRMALEVARRLKQELELRALGVAPQRLSGLLFQDLVERWVEGQEIRVRTRKKRPNSLATNVNNSRKLMTFFGGQDITSISERRIEQYQEWRLGQGWKPITVNGEVVLLLQMLRWAKKTGHEIDVPKVDQIPWFPEETVIPTKEEVARLLQFLPDSKRTLVWFIAETGCRRGEALNLTWDCVDEINGVVEIKQKDGWTPKTRQSQRRVYIGGGLLEAVRGLPKRSRYLFPGTNPDKPILGLEKTLPRAAKRANLNRNGKPIHVTPHTLRKAHATWLAMEGVPQQVLQARLGHARGSRITDQYYVFATEEAQRAAVVELPVARTNQRHKTL